MKKKLFFPLLGRFFDHFWSLVCRKRRLGSFSGVRRRSREEKKSNLKKKVLSAFFRHYGSEKRSVLGRCMCSRNHGGKKVICKK